MTKINLGKKDFSKLFLIQSELEETSQDMSQYSVCV